MIQSDGFGLFNRDILKYNQFIAIGIIQTADTLRSHLQNVSEGKSHYDTEGYINDIIEGYIIEGYKQFVHMLYSLSKL